MAVVGAGYIAVELAGILNTLGTETHLLMSVLYRVAQPPLLQRRRLVLPRVCVSQMAQIRPKT